MSRPDPSSLPVYLRQITSESAADNHQAGIVLVRKFVRHCQERGRSPETIRAYESMLRMYVDHLAGVHVLRATRDDMKAFVGRPRLRRGAGSNGSAGSRKRDTAVLRSFYGWLWEEGFTEDHLARGLHGPTMPKKNPRPLTDQQWLTLWQRHLADPDRVLLGLGFYIGLRVSELASLSPEQVTDTHIHDFIRKGGGEHTLQWADIMAIYDLRLPQVADTQGALLGALRRLREAATGPFLLPYNGKGNAVTKRFKTLATQVGLPHTTAHMMRHSAATNLIRAGVPLPLVMQILNHSNIQITMGYVQAGGAQLTEWLQGQS